MQVETPALSAMKRKATSGEHVQFFKIMLYKYGIIMFHHGLKETLQSLTYVKSWFLKMLFLFD